MALLTPLSSGNFSNYVYNIIDSSSANIYSSFSFANTAVNSGYILYYRLSGFTASTSTFSIGTTNSLTHLALRVNKWTQTVATFSICLIDSNSNPIVGSSITYSALGSKCAYSDSLNPYPELYPVAWSWHAFKFDSPISLSTTASYAIRFSYPVVSGISSTTAVANLFSADTTGTYSNGSTVTPTVQLQKFFITSATQTAGASDSIFIQGLFTGGTAYTPITMVMNATASAPTINGIELSYGGSLIFATAANTSYFLRLSGDLVINTEGYVGIGSSNSPLGTSSNANIEFVCPTASGAGIIMRAYGKFEAYGATLSYTKSLLASDTSGTSVITNVSTGWKIGDTIVFAPTGTNSYEFESSTISNISGANITLVSPLSYSHSGTSPYIGEVGNLSRNINIYALTYSSFIDFCPGDFNFQNVRFDNFGTNVLGPLSSAQPSVYTNTPQPYGTSFIGNFRIPYGINYGSDLFTTKASFTSYNPSYATSSILTSIGNSFLRSRIFQNCSFKSIGLFFSHGVFYFTYTTSGSYAPVAVQQLSEMLYDNNIIYDVGRNYSSTTYGGLFLNTMYTTNQGRTYFPKSVVSTSGTFSNNLFIGGNITESLSSNFFLSDFNFVNNTITGMSASGAYFSFGGNSQANWIGSISNNIFHSNNTTTGLVGPSDGNAYSIDSVQFYRQGTFFRLKFHDLSGKTVNNNTWWKNTLGPNYGACVDTTFTNINSYDNVLANSVFTISPNNIKIINSTFSGTANYGLWMAFREPSQADGSITYNFLFYGTYGNLLFDNCFFSNHSLADLSIIKYSSNNPSINNLIDSSIPIDIKLNNSKLLSSVYFTGSSVVNYETSVRFNNLNNGTYSVINQNGSISRDGSIYLSSQYSTRATPTINYPNLSTIPASIYSNYITKLKFGNKVIAYISGKRIQLSVNVRKSGAGVETIYNGNEVRLMIRQNSSIGINDDTVLVTSTSASNLGNWEKLSTIISYPNLSNVTIEVYLDCDGNAGFVNIDDWSLNYIQ